MALDEFDAIIAHAKRIVGASTRIAADAFPNGVELTCVTCGHSTSANAGQTARYLSTGWPTHCGATMRADTGALNG